MSLLYLIGFLLISLMANKTPEVNSLKWASKYYIFTHKKVGRTDKI
jgi:hypothetical protein